MQGTQEPPTKAWMSSWAKYTEGVQRVRFKYHVYNFVYQTRWCVKDEKGIGERKRALLSRGVRLLNSRIYPVLGL